MSSTVIKNGTVVTADLSYEADVKIEGGVITEIGKGLKGDKVLDATGCYVMPGGIDPHTHLEMPFMGTYSSDDFESGTRAAMSGGGWSNSIRTGSLWVTLTQFPVAFWAGRAEKAWPVPGAKLATRPFNRPWG